MTVDGTSTEEKLPSSTTLILFLRGTLGLFFSVLLTLLGLLLVTFLIGRVVPVDPVLAMVGDRASASVYEKARIELGLDRPLLEQFWIYLQKVLTGDFGTSVLTANKVIDDISRVFPATFELATFGILIGTLVGIPLGVMAAVRRGSLSDQFVRIFGLVGYSAPIFWLGLLSLLIFYAKLDWTAGPGRLDISYDYIVSPETGLLLLDSALQGEWEVFRNTFFPHCPTSIPSWLLLHGLHQPNDPFADAQ